MAGLEIAEVLNLIGDDRCSGYDELDERLTRLESVCARFETVLGSLPAIQEWREGVARWMTAEHEQVELMGTILLALKGLASIAQRPLMPDPPPPPSLPGLETKAE